MYACEVTDFDCDQLLSLEKLQSVTLRRILNLDKRCPKALVRLVTGVEPLEARFNLHKLMYFVKLAKSNKSSLLHTVHNRRMTDFGATPLGFHHTIYNLLIKYGLTNLWEIPKEASVLGRAKIPNQSSNMEISLGEGCNYIESLPHTVIKHILVEH